MTWYRPGPTCRNRPIPMDDDNPRGLLRPIIRNRETMMHNETKSVLQDWVMQLGLRHQGVLISSVRGTGSGSDARAALTREEESCMSFH